MQFYKRPGSKYYWCKFELLGKRYRFSTKETNRRKAEDFASAYRTGLNEGRVDLKRKKEAPSFKTAVKDFLDWSEDHHAEHPNTTKRYRGASKPLLRFFGKAQLDSITKDDVEAYRRWRAKQKSNKGEGKIKPATLNRELACLKVVFSHYMANDADDSIARNPVSKVKLQQENNEQVRVLSQDEEQKYLSHCSQPLKDIASLMLETGMRPDEVVHLTLKDVDLANKTIRVAKSKTQAGRRTLYLTERALEILSARVSKAKGPYLFPNKLDVNRPMIKSNHAHDSALTRSKLPHFRLYDCRHTFATRFIESGGDLVTLASVLGHSKINMVMRYAHPTAEHQEKAIRKMEAHSIASQMKAAEKGRPAMVN